MKDVLSFFSVHWFLAFVAMMLTAIILEHLIIRLPNRILRHCNIWKHGYPPPHCDADGDFKPEKKEENK